jgi:hypothetical protein
VSWISGLFCANFGLCATSSSTCRNAWCPDCYTSTRDIEFHIALREGEGMDPSETVDDEDRLASVWRQKPRDKDKFKRARKGDHLMVQSECDFCIFAKLKRRAPDLNNSINKLVMACIRRATLDAFWSWAERTVVSHARHVQKGIKLAESIGIDPPFVPVGPLPDHCGYGLRSLSSSSHGKRGSTTRRINSGKLLENFGPPTETRFGPDPRRTARAWPWEMQTERATRDSARIHAPRCGSSVS